MLEGCCMSPVMFNVYLEENREGESFNGKRGVYNTFDDYMMVLAKG